MKLWQKFNIVFKHIQRFLISRYLSPRAKKLFELKYMQHIVIIYWLCITCIPYVNYEIVKYKPPHDLSVSFFQQLRNWKYRVSKGIILSFCLLAQMHNSIASSPSHIFIPCHSKKYYKWNKELYILVGRYVNWHWIYSPLGFWTIKYYFIKGVTCAFVDIIQPFKKYLYPFSKVAV